MMSCEKQGFVISNGGYSEHLTKPIGLCYNLLHAWLPAPGIEMTFTGSVSPERLRHAGKGAERKLKGFVVFPEYR